MPDILIRGMDIPKDGRKHTALLQFLEDGKCRGIVEYSKSYDDRSVKVFEVVPLPEGHGRLIDADKLAEDLQLDVEYEQRALDDLNIVCVNRERLQFDKDCKQNCMWYLSECPTIIPAEGGTDDG